MFSSQALTALGYPGRPSQPHYLVFNVEPAGEFDGATWDLAALLPAVAIASVGVPLSLSLDVVIRARV